MALQCEVRTSSPALSVVNFTVDCILQTGQGDMVKQDKKEQKKRDSCITGHQQIHDRQQVRNHGGRNRKHSGKERNNGGMMEECAEMCCEPDRMGPGRGPGARSALRYSEAGAQILNLWNSQALHLCYPHSYLLLSYLFIARIRFQIKHSHAEGCVTRSCMAWLSHIFISFPPPSHLHFSWTIVLPGGKDIYNTLMLLRTRQRCSVARLECPLQH